MSAGVQLRSRDVGQVDLPHHAHTERGGALPRRAEIGQVEDQHVAAVAPSPREVTPRRRTGPGGRDHLQKTVAEGEHRVDKAERADAGIVERLAERKRSTHIVGDRMRSRPAASTAWRKPHPCTLGADVGGNIIHTLGLAPPRAHRRNPAAPCRPIPQRPRQGGSCSACGRLVRSPRDPSAAIYGVITIGALLAAESGRRETHLDTVASVIVAAGLYWLAHAYAGLLGRRLDGRERLTGGALLQALAHDWPLLRGASLPLGALLIAWLLGADQYTAISAALWSAVASLLALELVAGVRSRATRGELLLQAGVGLGMGLAIIALRLIV